MISGMIVTFLESSVGQTLTREVVNGLILLIHAAVTHHAETAVAAERANEAVQPPR